LFIIILFVSNSTAPMQYRKKEKTERNVTARNQNKINWVYRVAWKVSHYGIISKTACQWDYIFSSD